MKRIRPPPWEGALVTREDFWELPCLFLASKGLGNTLGVGPFPCGSPWVCFQKEGAQGWACCQEDQGVS